MKDAVGDHPARPEPRGASTRNVCYNLNSANTKHLYNICTTSDQRHRHWFNIVQMLYKMSWVCSLSIMRLRLTCVMNV